VNASQVATTILIAIYHYLSHSMLHILTLWAIFISWCQMISPWWL